MTSQDIAGLALLFGIFLVLGVFLPLLVLHLRRGKARRKVRGEAIARDVAARLVDKDTPGRRSGDGDAHVAAMQALTKNRRATEELDDMKWSATHWRGGRHSPPGIDVSVAAALSAQAIVTRESRSDRLARAVGLSREVQTGDALFDDFCYIDSDDVEAMRLLFASAEAREATMSLLAAGAREVRLEPQGVCARIEGLVPSDLGEDRFRTLVTRLTALRKAAAPLSCGPEAGRARWPRARRRALVGGLATAVAAGFLTVGILLYDSDALLVGGLYGFALTWSVPIAMALAGLGFLALRGHSDSHIHFGYFLVICAILCLATGPGIASWLNRARDTSVPEVVDVQVTGKHITSHRHASYYHLDMANPRQPGGTYSWTVSERLYDEARVGWVADLRIRSGALGYAWVEEMEAAHPAPAEQP